MVLHFDKYLTRLKESNAAKICNLLKFSRFVGGIPVLSRLRKGHSASVHLKKGFYEKTKLIYFSRQSKYSLFILTFNSNLTRFLRLTFLQKFSKFNNIMIGFYLKKPGKNHIFDFC